MLKRNWRNNRLFCHSFVIGEISIGGVGGGLAYAYAPSEENKKSVRKFSVRFLAFSNEISTVQKIVLSSGRGQGNFRGLEALRPRPRTWGFEARPRTSKCVSRTSSRPRTSSRTPPVAFRSSFSFTAASCYYWLEHFHKGSVKIFLYHRDPT